MDLWTDTLDALAELVEPYDYMHWIRPVRCAQIDDARHEIVLTVPDASHGEWLENRFLGTIKQAMSQGSSTTYRVVIQTESAPSPKPSKAAPQIAPAQSGSALVPHYRFENFVDGPNNQFAMTAAQAAAEHPGARYNPLFLYGGVGLGKTHLLHAVGHAVRDRDPSARIVYVTSETYVNDLIGAIRSDAMDAFRRKYRDECDVLLIDDIQFIAGKERTQEEFFHMFNCLHAYGRQIVMTCDQLPRSIKHLEDRLKSRFEWGLIADIKPPSFETRVAIIGSKAEQHKVRISDEVAMFLARHVSRNVRELEGALMRLAATAQIFRTTISLGMAKEVLGALIEQNLHHVSIPAIIKLVAHEFDLTIADLKGPRRQRFITIPRQIAMLLARTLTKASLPKIGAAFGGRDHTTVINAIKRMKVLKDADPEIAERIDRLSRQLNP